MPNAKKDFGCVDITAWNFPDLEIPVNKLVKSISDVLRSQFKETPPDIYLPLSVDAGDVRIKVNIPVGPDENGVIYSVSLKQLIDDVIECNRNGMTGKIKGGEERDLALWIVKNFRDAANRLERMIEK